MWCRNSTCNSKLLLHGALELLRRTTELFPPFKLGTATALRMRQVPGARPKHGPKNVQEADADEDRNDVLRATAADRVETMLASCGLHLHHKPAKDGITPKEPTDLSRSVYQLQSMDGRVALDVGVRSSRA